MNTEPGAGATIGGALNDGDITGPATMPGGGPWGTGPATAMGLDPHDEHPTGAAAPHGEQQAALCPSQQWANGRQQQHPAENCETTATRTGSKRDRRDMVKNL